MPRHPIHAVVLLELLDLQLEGKKRIGAEAFANGL